MKIQELQHEYQNIIHTVLREWPEGAGSVGSDNCMSISEYQARICMCVCVCVCVHTHILRLSGAGF